jgi:hypothetical protein
MHSTTLRFISLLFACVEDLRVSGRDIQGECFSGNWKMSTRKNLVYFYDFNKRNSNDFSDFNVKALDYMERLKNKSPYKPGNYTIKSLTDLKDKHVKTVLVITISICLHFKIDYVQT